MILDFFETHLGSFSDAWKLSKEKYNLQVLRFKNQPFVGVDTYITLGLSHYPLKQRSNSTIKQELLISVKNNYSKEQIASFLLSFAESILDSSKALMRGEVVGPGKNIIDKVKCNAIYVTLPVFFGDDFSSYINKEDEIIMCWLLPITEKDTDYIKNSGWNKFELYLETINDINTFWDINRDITLKYNIPSQKSE